MQHSDWPEIDDIDPAYAYLIADLHSLLDENERLRLRAEFKSRVSEILKESSESLSRQLAEAKDRIRRLEAGDESALSPEVKHDRYCAKRYQLAENRVRALKYEVACLKHQLSSTK